MNVSIFGLGYVGVVTAGCLASRGHRIIGVDNNAVKVDMLNNGQSPIIEAGLQELLESARGKGLISATTDHEEAIFKTELSIISVGTPSRQNGSLDTRFLEDVCAQIGCSLSKKEQSHILVFRSTMLPGTMRAVVIPALERFSGKRNGDGYHVVFNPEFLRESSAVYDFNNPPKTVIGSDSEETADFVLKLYEGLPGPMIKTSLEVAEMVKYADNNFHALKITFANEMGHICKKLGIDSYEVMNIFVQDCKLNISPAYLKPGFAFGGSCLPKDLRAMNYLAKIMNQETPLLNSLIYSNNLQIASAIERVISFGKRKIGVAGLSFKAGTDDLRESPVIEIIEALLGKGYEMKLYDRNVNPARLIGANKSYIESHIPHISRFMANSLDEILAESEVIIISNKDDEFKRILAESKDDQIVFDLIRITDDKTTRSNYEGICW